MNAVGVEIRGSEWKGEKELYYDCTWSRAKNEPHRFIFK
jgi:hypothetical protein